MPNSPETIRKGVSPGDDTGLYYSAFAEHVAVAIIDAAAKTPETQRMLVTLTHPSEVRAS